MMHPDRLRAYPSRVSDSQQRCGYIFFVQNLMIFESVLDASVCVVPFCFRMVHHRECHASGKRSSIVLA
jgi:hypothetical protein